MLTLVNARLIDPETDEARPGGMVIAEGRIQELLTDSTQGRGTGRIVDCDGKWLAPGIIDIGVKIGEPGERHKESFRTAGAAAAAGGVTTMVTRPDTSPAIDTPEGLEFLLHRSVEAGPVRVMPMAALTKGREGAEMTEIGFLMDAGAVAFTDARAVANVRVFQRCLTYAAGLGALIIGHPQDPVLSAGACATSGPFASQLGLPSVSPMAERIGLERDLAIVEMTGARYHADQISTARALPALARAKAAGLAVTAGCSIHHLTLNEFDIGDYRTFFKLTPPLRSEDDRIAMVEAVMAGAIGVPILIHQQGGDPAVIAATVGCGKHRRPAPRHGVSPDHGRPWAASSSARAAILPRLLDASGLSPVRRRRSLWTLPVMSALRILTPSSRRRSPTSHGMGPGI